MLQLFLPDLFPINIFCCCRYGFDEPLESKLQTSQETSLYFHMYLSIKGAFLYRIMPVSHLDLLKFQHLGRPCWASDWDSGHPVRGVRL